jgi:hypothetical protein
MLLVSLGFILNNNPSILLKEENENNLSSKYRLCSGANLILVMKKRLLKKDWVFD